MPVKPFKCLSFNHVNVRVLAIWTISRQFNFVNLLNKRGPSSLHMFFVYDKHHHGHVEVISWTC